MTGLVIGIPWRPSDSEDRQRAFAYVHDHLCNLDTIAATVGTFDADPSDPFSRGRSANLAFATAELAGADTVIIHDADMVLPPESYSALDVKARATDRLVVGFNDYRVLDKPMSSKVYAGADPFRLPFAHRLLDFSVGGVMAMTVAAWEEVGGFDPRFAGWGMEDWAFAHASKLILGPWIRLDGPGCHLFHPSEKDRWPAERKANEVLHARYTACTTADEVRAIRAEVEW